MKIEAGKFYRTRDGRKIGPMKKGHGGVEHKWIVEFGDGMSWKPDGTSAHCADLIAEWTEGPVREVTRKEIVPGVYGRLCIDAPLYEDIFRVKLADRHGDPDDDEFHSWNAAELTAAIDTLTQIRNAMQEGGE
jgi:hypothetical protein